MQAIIAILAGILFLVSIVGWILVRIILKPKLDESIEEYYWEFEDQNPEYQKYTFYNKLCYTIAAIAALLLFICPYL